MPYFPPADFPPPPLVQTVQIVASADGGDLPSDSQDIIETRPSQPSIRPAATGGSTSLQQPAPEPTTHNAQFSEPISVSDVESPAPSETQASFLLEASQPQARPTHVVPLSTAEKSAATAATAAESEPTLRPFFSESWVSQRREPQPTDAADEEDEEIDSGDRPEVDEESEDEASNETTFPRAATPEQDWSNGAVIENGVLLTPTQPTNRPPAPLRLTADYQEFEPQTQVLTARGGVVLRLRNGVLQADRLWANLANRFVIVEGNVAFTRGEQTIEADRGEYNLIQGEGSLFDARGTLFLPRTDTDLGGFNDPQGPTEPGIIATDPIGSVQGTNSINFGTGVTVPTDASGLPVPNVGGAVRRFRFEAAQLDFDSEGWYAQEIAFTNDPFSPPELVFRGDSATLTRVTEFQDELYVQNAQLVFDQGLRVPLLRERVLVNRGGPDSANPFFVNFAYDDRDRDGLFVERSFRVFDSGAWQFFLTPQILAQRFVTSDSDASFLSNFGLEADLTGFLGPRTAVSANASFSGLDLDNIEERLRSSVRVQRLIGDHTLNLEYSYRDRLFNGSLGFQTVQSSLGVVLVSPFIEIGDTGIFINYQASAQYINADTDRLDLLDDLTPPFRVSLGRLQGSVGISRGFTLWRGEALPATPDAGLRFTSVPRVPNIQLVLSGRGTYTYYTSDDTQDNLSGSISLFGEFGHFSKDFLDSTVFNLTYSRAFISDTATSPFLFDRNVDSNTLSGGIIQQIYGPFRLGFQTSFNLDTGEVINTDYLLEYNRRTYSIFLRFNPTQSVGFLGFRLSEFDWAGRAARFGGADIQQVEGGVVQ